MGRYELREADLGRPLSLQVGDQLAVRLNENPTTGYRWNVDMPTTTVVAPSGSSFVSRSSALGASGERQLLFDAVGPGTVRVQFELRRSATAHDTARRHLELEIHVAN